MRIISGNQILAHTKPIFKEFEILPYTSHIQHAELLFMHSILYKYRPKSFLETWQTNSDHDQPHDLRNHEYFKIPFPRIELFKGTN
jgi:hypothetical protein